MSNLQREVPIQILLRVQLSSILIFSICSLHKIFHSFHLHFFSLPYSFHFIPHFHHIIFHFNLHTHIKLIQHGKIIRYATSMVHNHYYNLYLFSDTCWMEQVTTHDTGHMAYANGGSKYQAS